MNSFIESNCNFMFNQNIKCYNFDSKKESIFKENDFCGNSPIDFLFLYKNDIFFMEVKDINYFKDYFGIEDSNKRGAFFDKQVCDIYAKYIDSYTILSLSNNQNITEYQNKLTKLSKVPKIILFVVNSIKKEELLLFIEKLEKKLKKKFKNLKIDSIFVETLNNYNNELYVVRQGSVK